MIQVRLNGVSYNICNTWGDVDLNKLVECETSKDELIALSDIPRKLVYKYEDLQLFPLYTLISFIHESELLPYVDAGDISLMSYNLFEQGKKAISEGKPYQRIIKAGKIYFPEEKNSVRLIGLGLSILNQIALFLENYRDMLEDPPEKNAVEAGIEELSGFGHWGTAYNLVGRDLFKIDQMLALPAIKVYTALHYSWKEAKYQKRKYDLDHPPRK
jgi:hypothetical protein